MIRLARTFNALQEHRATIERKLLPIASVAFLAGTALAFRRIELSPGQIRWSYLLVVVLIGVPATVVLNALEITLAAKTVDRTISPRAALRLSILASAANLLPLPGSVILRTGDLVSRGSRTSQAFRSQLGVGLIWVSMSLYGLAIATYTLGLSATLPAAAIATATIPLALIALPTRHLLLTFMIVLVEAITVVVTAVRLLLVWLALGLPGGFAAALAVGASTAIAALVWVVPAGLGIRESLGSLFATLVGVSAAIGFAGQAVDRILGMMGNGILAVAVVRSKSIREGGLRS